MQRGLSGSVPDVDDVTGFGVGRQHELDHLCGSLGAGEVERGRLVTLSTRRSMFQEIQSRIE